MNPRYSSLQGLGIAPVVVTAIIAGVQVAISLFTGRQRGAQKEATTVIVNSTEQYLIQNLNAWDSTSPKTIEAQQLALQNFDALWNDVVSRCSDPAYGPPGKWCVEDRQRGGEFDWFRRYRDPIANSEIVQATAGTAIQSLLPSQLQGLDLTLVAGIGLLVAVLFLGKGKKES